MKTLLRRCGTRMIIVALALTCCMSLRGATADNSSEQYAQIDPNVDVRALSNPDALSLAYGVLYVGNHNYNGHRASAMREIRKAAAILGVELKGDGQGHEEQQASDEAFHLAQRILEQVRTRLTTQDQQPILEHVDGALDHLSKGLKIRKIEQGS